jgi:hypothetical protein
MEVPQEVSCRGAPCRQHDTQVQIRGSGFFEIVPSRPDLHDGLLHAPKLQALPNISMHVAWHAPSAKVRQHQLQLKSTNPSLQASQRMFHLEGSVPLAEPLTLRVEKWQRGAFLAPGLLPRFPPWLQPGVINAQKSGALRTFCSPHTHSCCKPLVPRHHRIRK